METERIQVNGRPVPLDGHDLAQVLAGLGYPEDRPGIAVALNGRVVRRQDWRGHRVVAGDEIEVVGAAAGG